MSYKTSSTNSLINRIVIFALVITTVTQSVAQYPKRIPYRDGKKWGYASVDGIVIIVPQFDSVGFFEFNKEKRDVAKVKIDEHYHYIDPSGNEVKGEVTDNPKATIQLMPMIMKSLSKLQKEIDEELYFFKQEGRFGYHNEKGDTILKATFLNHGFVSNEIISMKSENGWAVYDTVGEIVSDYYDTIGYLGPSKIFIVKKNDRYGLINRKGQKVAPLKYNFLEQGHASMRAIVARKKKRYGMIDWTGKEVLPFKYRSVNPWYYISFSCYLTTARDGALCFVSDKGLKYCK